jgi:hypothetical protein
MRALFCLLCLIFWARPGLAVEVDVELFLAVDVSRSMEPWELELQRRGYAEALQSDAVWQAIQTGALQTIAVTYVEWAGAGHTREVVGWTHVQTRADLAGIAARISAHFDGHLRRTSISSALGYAADCLNANAFEGLRRVIDVSGDGPNNAGDPVTQARDAVLAQGITINGLPLMTYDPDGPFSAWGIPDLDVYYRECVIGGVGAFLIPVRDWQDFPQAVRDKLVLELAGRAPARVWRAAGQDYDCLIGERIWERNRGIFWNMP